MKTFQLALVTGASSGIGEALAHLLAKKNIPLILAGRNLKKLENLKSALRVPVTIVASDLSIHKERQKLMAVIRSQVPDLVINNAGFGIYGDAVSISFEEQTSILEVNAIALLELTLETARSLSKANKMGVILNVSSIAGEYPTPGMSVYGASKAFVTHFSKSVDAELRGSHIRVLASCPGMVSTDFANRAAKHPVLREKKWAMDPRAAAEAMWKQIVQGKKKKIMDWRYRILCAIARWMPETWIESQTYRRIKKRTGKTIK